MINPRVIAFYLPQFHPIPENDLWWGKGFTEWTNVGKARPLFRGHYQPKVPADLGYYDLRLPEAREAQAQMAKEYGIEGFCYWHYWFGNGKRLLERPFVEVLKSGKPDFPFCLGWANHSWRAKTWMIGKEDKVLIKQLYPGIKDFTDHFNEVKKAFHDKRYIRVNNKPLFVIWNPMDFPGVKDFLKLWNTLAENEGLGGIYFVAYCVIRKDTKDLLNMGFDSVTYDYISDLFKNINLKRKVFFKIRKLLFSVPKVIDYNKYIKLISESIDELHYTIPCVIPNFDHSPRSGKNAWIISNSTPDKFGKVLETVINRRKKSAQDDIIFIKSWNEWGEGNYLEPDLRYGRGYLEQLSKHLKKH